LDRTLRHTHATPPPTTPVTTSPHPDTPHPYRGAAEAPGHGPDALARTERHLHMLRPTEANRTMMRWRATCPELEAAGLIRPGELWSWLRQLPIRAADVVLGTLVRHVQHGDGTALLTVLVCLAPGIRSLAARTGSTVDEVVSEVSLGLFDYPVDRRTSIAGGVLLDTRNRLHRAEQRTSRTQPLDDTDHPEAQGELGDEGTSTRRAVRLVCQAHRQGVIDRTDTQLILHTRIAGHPVKPVAHHLGLSPSAAYQRRQRAETRLIDLVA
jgi:hypothetical protein